MQDGFVRVPRAPDQPAKPVVCLALPTYDGRVSLGCSQAYELLPTRGAVDLIRARANSSFLTKAFNSLWCAALNARKAGVTHFAMIHADISPVGHGWLDVLVKELIDNEADVVAAVSPLKSEHGLTSTAVAMDLEDPWLCRRLTMREVYELPETFGAEDAGGPLLLNTGLWVCDLRRPWFEELNNDLLTTKIRFDVKNRIIHNPLTGEYHAEAISEDWLFSQELNRRGAKLMATRKVQLAHEGGKDYRSDRAWGTLATDEVFHKLHEKVKYANQVREGVHGQGEFWPSVQGKPGSECVGRNGTSLHQQGRRDRVEGTGEGTGETAGEACHGEVAAR